MSNELLSLAYDSINKSKAARLRDCASVLFFKRGAETGRLTLDTANFCRVRLCPMCQWRRSMKAFGQTQKIVSAIQRERPRSYAMLTLTVQSCTADMLSATIDEMMRAWDRLTKRAPWKRAVLGAYRGLEVTHNTNPNSSSYNTYHPHFHVLLCLNASYWTSRDYLKQAEWCDMWRASLRANYTPIIDIRKCKVQTDAAIAEVSKYTTKSADIIVPDDWDLTIETVKILDKALDKRRLVAYSGIMAEWHRKLNLDDTDEGDLIHVENEDPAEALAAMVVYSWYTGYRQYFKED